VLRDSALISADLTTLAPCPPEPEDELLPVTGGQQGAASLVPLPFDVIDAAYSRELGRIVIVSSDPPRLRLLEPATGSVDAVVDLPLAPTRVVLEAGGSSALVGHHGWLSRVSLAPPALGAVHALSATAHDIAIANGRAYVMPERDQSTRLRVIDLATGEEMRTANIRAGIGLRTAPDGLSLLMTHPSTSSNDDLRRISVADADTPPQDVLGVETRDVLVTADVGYAIWTASDGARLLGSGAGVFDLSDPQAASYAKVGALAGLRALRRSITRAAAGESSWCHGRPTHNSRPSSICSTTAAMRGSPAPRCRPSACPGAPFRPVACLCSSPTTAPSSTRWSKPCRALPSAPASGSCACRSPSDIRDANAKRRVRGQRSSAEKRARPVGFEPTHFSLEGRSKPYDFKYLNASSVFVPGAGRLRAECAWTNLRNARGRSTVERAPQLHPEVRDAIMLCRRVLDLGCSLQQQQ